MWPSCATVLACGPSWPGLTGRQDRLIARSHRELKLMVGHERWHARTNRDPGLTLQSDLLQTGWSRDRIPASCTTGNTSSSIEVRPVCLAHLQGVHGIQRSYV